MENLVELNEKELKDIEGGGYWLPIIATYILLEAALNPSAHIKAFKEGYDAHQKMIN